MNLIENFKYYHSFSCKKRSQQNLSLSCQKRKEYNGFQEILCAKKIKNVPKKTNFSEMINVEQSFFSDIFHNRQFKKESNKQNQQYNQSNNNLSDNDQIIIDQTIENNNSSIQSLMQDQTNNLDTFEKPEIKPQFNSYIEDIIMEKNQTNYNEINDLTDTLQKFTIISDNIKNINFPKETFEEHQLKIQSKVKIQSEQFQLKDKQFNQQQQDNYLYELIVENHFILNKQYYQVSQQEFNQVRLIWKNQNNINQPFIKFDYIPQILSYKNLQTLSKNNWLNDEVINAYCIIIKRFCDSKTSNKTKIMNSFFFPEILKCFQTLDPDFTKIMRIVKRNQIDISQEILFIPMNINENHWVFIQVDFNQKKISYYDGLCSSNQQIFLYLNHVKQLIEHIQSSSGQQIYQWQINVGNFPRQHNGHDCGVFMLMGIKDLALYDQIQFSQDDMHYFRILICHELIQGKCR